jgi:stage IV sporulation protein FB
MRSFWRLGKWRGIPISLHWSVFIGVVWFYFQTRSLSATAISLGAFVFLLLAHELGHAAVARLRHVQVYGIELFIFHGTCSHEAPYDELDDVLIAWGGVAAQFVVLLVALNMDMLFASSFYTHRLISPLLSVFIEANIVIMIVNLIPVAPLDGATAWRALPLFARWVKRMPWMAGVRKAREKSARGRRINAQSERTVVDIADKLKKRNNGRP